MDTHGMKFVVDTAGVAKGFRDYKSAVDGIFASLSKFENHVDKTMKGVAKASANPQALNAFKKAVSAFAKVDIDTSAARKLSALSAAMRGFKAPTNAQTTNTKRFFNVLSKGLPDLSSAYRSIKMMNDLKTAMAGFRAPPTSASKNLLEFARSLRSASGAFGSLKNVAGISRAAQELTQLGTAFQKLRVPSASQVTNLGNFALVMRSFNFSNLVGTGNFFTVLGVVGKFRAPSAAQTRNFQTFVAAVAAMRLPPNAAALAAALAAIGAAAQRAADGMRKMRAGAGGLGNSLGNLGNQARGASLQMMGLQNAFSGTFQVASVLRSLLGSLTIAEVGRNYFEATNAALQFNAQMMVLNKEASFATVQMDFVRSTARALGTDLLSSANGFAKISIAADKSNMSVMQTRHIFEGFTTGMTVLGTTVAGQGDVWLALQQVMNKGYLSAEELNQQLNEKLPGAMAYAGEYAKSLGMSLEVGLKTKALDAAGVLEHIAKRFKEDFGPSVASALLRPSAQMNILRGNFDQLYIAIGEAGGNNAFGQFLSNINEKLTPEAIDRYAAAIADGLTSAVQKLSDGFNFLYNNWDSIKGPLSTTLEIMGKWMIVSSTLQIARFIVLPLLAIGPALAGLKQAGLLMAFLIKPTAQLSLALTGGFARAAVSITAFKLSLLSSIATMRAATVSGGFLAASMKAVGAGAVALGVGVRGLIALLGGPYLLTLAAVTYSLYKIYSGFSESNVIINTNKKFLSQQRVKLEETKLSLDRVTGSTTISRNATANLTSATQTGAAYMDAYNAKLNEATGGLWDMARAARAATIENLKLQRADVTKRLTTLTMNSSSGMMDFAGRMWDEGQYGNAALSVGAAGVAGAKSFFGFGPSQDVINKELAAGHKTLNEIDALLVRANNTTDMDYLEDLQNTYPNFGKTAGSAGVSTEDSGDGKKKKKPKGSGASKAAREADRVANSVDGIISTLMEHDPVGKLYYEFVDTLGQQAKVLLNDKGYAQFMANVEKENKSGVVSVQSLISVMEQGGTTSVAVMDMLQKKYGLTSDEIIKLLGDQQTALEEAYTDAAIKELDKSFRSLSRGIEMVGDSIPAIAELGANLQTIEGLARFVMPSDSGFLQFMTDLRSGAMTATEALAQLNIIMMDPSKRSTTANQFLANPKTGVTGQDLVDSVERNIRVNEMTRKEAELDLMFGDRLLANGKDELSLLRMTTGQAEEYSLVMEEVNRMRALDGPVSQERINNLLAEVEAQKALGRQLQRNREFFENNGVRSYINDVKSVGESINELDKTFLKSLEDQLVSLGTKGEFSFKSIFNALQAGLIEFSTQNLLKEGLGKLFKDDTLEGGAPSLMGKVFGFMGFKNEAGTADPLGSKGRPMHVIIDGSTGNIVDALPDDLKANVGQTYVDDPLATMTDTINGISNTIKQDWAAGVEGIGGRLAQFASVFTSTMGAGSAGGGGGGLLGGLLQLGMSFLPGAGATAGIASSMSSAASSVSAAMSAKAGMFSEGGYAGSAVSHMMVHPSAFTNAPQYAEGTPNTSGGHPAILHDNEAVIPLSRGRKVAVEMSGGSRGQVINNNFTVNTPDADSFRKSDQQIATQMHMQAGRAYRRNHG